MSTSRTIEIFSAGCPACQNVINLVNDMVCSSCTVSVLDMNDPKVAAHAASLGVASVPAVAVDGKLADCCAARGVDEAKLRAAGVGQPLA